MGANPSLPGPAATDGLAPILTIEAPPARSGARVPLPAPQPAGGRPLTTPGCSTAGSWALRAKTSRTSASKLSSGSIG